MQTSARFFWGQAKRCLLTLWALGSFAWPGRAWAQTDGRLTSVVGRVYLAPPGGAEAAVASGATVPSGSRLRTDVESTAEVAFADGSVLRMRAGSKVKLSGSKRRRRRNSLVVFFGRVWSRVTAAVGEERTYEIKTPNAVCGVRGTEFETAVADDGSLRVRVAKGEVGVAGDTGEEVGVRPGQEVEADENGVNGARETSGEASWERWRQGKRERLRRHGRAIVDAIKRKIVGRKGRLEALRAKQTALVNEHQALLPQARAGDPKARERIEETGSALATIVDAIADLGDEADSQFGIVDHVADLAADPRFALIDRKYLEAEAASLRRVKKMFDAMVAEGTDISIEGMGQMLDDMRRGKGSLREKKGSSADDLFGDDDFLK